MKTIQINGKEYNLKYSLHTAISYERMTGNNAFDLNTILKGNVSEIATVGYCMIVGSNKSYPTYEEFLQQLDTIDSMTAFIKAATEELALFYNHQPGDKTLSKEEEETTGKNV